MNNALFELIYIIFHFVTVFAFGFVMARRLYRNVTIHLMRRLDIDQSIEEYAADHIDEIKEIADEDKHNKKAAKKTDPSKEDSIEAVIAADEFPLAIETDGDHLYAYHAKSKAYVTNASTSIDFLYQLQNIVNANKKTMAVVSGAELISDFVDRREPTNIKRKLEELNPALHKYIRNKDYYDQES